MSKKESNKSLSEGLIVRGRYESRTFFDDLTDDQKETLREIAIVVSKGGVSLLPTAVQVVEKFGLSVVPRTVVTWLKREAARNGDPQKQK